MPPDPYHRTPPRTLIVTPYLRESRAVIERCIASVAAQSVPADHLLVADGGAAGWIDALPVRHIRLDRTHGDAGNTPRAIGLLLGIAEGYGALGLLDVDNILAPDHLATCLAAAQAAPDRDYVIARRRFCRPDGTPIAALPEEAIEEHVDTSCFLFLPGSYPLLPFWGTMPRELSPICDRIFYRVLKAHRMRPAIADHVTVDFQVNLRAFYTGLGEAPPAEARDTPDFAAIQRWIDALDDAGLARASLRAGVPLFRTGERVGTSQT